MKFKSKEVLVMATFMRTLERAQATAIKHVAMTFDSQGRGFESPDEYRAYYLDRLRGEVGIDPAMTLVASYIGPNVPYARTTRCAVKQTVYRGGRVYQIMQVHDVSHETPLHVAFGRVHDAASADLGFTTAWSCTPLADAA